MIVISGALVLVALVLLVIGLIGSTLTFVYLSIAVSLASFAFLVFGILQRRKEVLPGTAAGTGVPGDGAPKAGVGSVVLAGDKALHRGDAEAEPTAVSTFTPRTATPPAVATVGGQVLVVAGRPRYHVDGCRYLAGKEADAMDVVAARTEGFTACGVCKPDDNLAPAVPTVVIDDVEDDVDLAEVAEIEDAPVAPEPVRATRKAAVTTKIAAPAVKAVKPAAATSLVKKPSTMPEPVAAKAPAKAARAVPAQAAPAAAAPVKAVKAAPAPVKAVKAAPTPVKAVKAAPTPVKAAKAAPAPVKAAPAPVKAAKAAPTPVKAVKAAPAKAAPAPAKAAPAKAAPVKRAGVIVIPDRGKYHTPECRYVRGAEGTLELTKAAAAKQGYEACGVCSP